MQGALRLKRPFGTFVPPNITPHRDAGIGHWTIQDFAKAVRQGVSPEGDPYYPVFTYSFYAGFTDQEVADLWEAFRTVPPVAVAAPAHDVGFPFSFRSGLKLWRAAYLDAPKTDALMGTVISMEPRTVAGRGGCALRCLSYWTNACGRSG